VTPDGQCANVGRAKLARPPGSCGRRGVGLSIVPTEVAESAGANWPVVSRALDSAEGVTSSGYMERQLTELGGGPLNLGSWARSVVPHG
jgi:hypothetical protein